MTVSGCIVLLGRECPPRLERAMAPVRVVHGFPSDLTECIGVVAAHSVSESEVQAWPQVPRAGYSVTVPGARRVESESGLREFTSYCVALAYCDSPRVAGVVARHVSAESAQLLALRCTNLSVSRICGVLGVGFRGLYEREHALARAHAVRSIAVLVAQVMKEAGESALIVAPARLAQHDPLGPVALRDLQRSSLMRPPPKPPILHEPWRAELEPSEPLGRAQLARLLVAMLTVSGPITIREILTKLEAYAVARGVGLDQTLVSVVLAEPPFVLRSDERFSLGVEEVSV